LRVVVDTNVLLSRLLLGGSVSGQAMDKALEQAEVVVSEATMEELADVLSRKKWDRYISVEDRQEFIRRLLQVADMVPVLSEIDDCRDAKDNRFLALALDADAGYIITGDSDLLVLHPWRGIQVITPGDFLQIDLQ
jgi:putative PIN family toxin of toxin-antitoxin system